MPVAPFLASPCLPVPYSPPLPEAEIQEALSDRLPGWSCEDDTLHKTFELESFRVAVGFIVRISFCAETLNHHPKIETLGGRVSVALTTLAAGGKVTERDLKLARRIEELDRE